MVMYIRVLLYVIGFLLSIIGSIYIIMYLSYLSIGYSFIDYLNFVITRGECLITIIGLFFISIAIFKKGI